MADAYHTCVTAPERIERAVTLAIPSFSNSPLTAAGVACVGPDFRLPGLNSLATAIAAVPNHHSESPSLTLRT